MALISLTIDSREPPAVAALFDGVAPYAVAELATGDALALTDSGHVLCIERKEPSDLCASIQDGRLLTQAARMHATSPWSYLVVTGPMWGDAKGGTWHGGQLRGWPWPSIQGALLNVQELGVQTLFLHSEAEYPKAILRLAERRRDAAMRLPPLRAGVALSEAEAIMLSLPGIGEVHCKAVLGYCGSVAWSLDYLTTNDDSDMRKIPGIGPSTRARIRRALGLKDGERLSVYVEETGQLATSQPELEAAS